MSYVKNASKFMSAASLLIPGRCRIASVQMGIQGNWTRGTTHWDGDYYVEFKNGSSSGDSILRLPIMVSENTGFSNRSSPKYYNFGNARVLFSDGVYVPALATGDGANLFISVFYEGA
jgi:hypothetical protein